MSKIKFTGCMAVAALIASMSAVAQDTRDGELAMADDELNAAYKALLANLDTAGQQHLRAAQRAWIQMRDADCQWAFVDRRDCLIDRTTNRTEELKNTYFSAKDGEYKSLSDAE
ncbi:MAG TPA: lysozyme inhibitor LprI family protein [Lysobacter sp.]|nr:lysozyme inhibitor LprI family protein [Lysobacter sp.]